VLRANLDVTGGDIAWSLLLFVGPFVVSFVFCLFTFRYVPRASPAMRDVWPGALVAACGFEGLKFGYTFYLVHFSSYDAAFGALGSVLILLFFTYLAFQIFYLGAEVSHVYPSVRDGTYVQPQTRVAAGPRRPRDILFGLVGFVLGLFIAPRDTDADYER
jgi:membrane protein